MKYHAQLKKMATENAEVVQYYLDTENDFLNMNQLLGKDIDIEFIKYQCLNCTGGGKIFRQGYCYNCFYQMPEVGDWVMRPELSKAHLGIADRNLEFEKNAQLQPHIVYLALSSNIKVGVTRKSQTNTRWIDQGANEAIPIVEVPNRYLAGITEVVLKKYVTDKTNWQKMLKNEIDTADLVAEKNKLKQYIPNEVAKYFIENSSKTIHFNYPVLSYPKSVKSLDLEKKQKYSGKLSGIKGQYLIFEDGTVFNVRNNEGIVCRLGIV